MPCALQLPASTRCVCGMRSVATTPAGSDGQNPLGVRSARFNHIITAGWREPADDADNMTWADGFHAAMTPHYGAGVYVNYLDRGEPAGVIETAYGAANWARLRQLKRRYDADNMFRRNHNIPPADS